MCAGRGEVTVTDILRGPDLQVVHRIGQPWRPASSATASCADALMNAGDGRKSFSFFIYGKTHELIQCKSCRAVGTSTHTVGTVRDVLKCVPILDYRHRE